MVEFQMGLLQLDKHHNCESRVGLQLGLLQLDKHYSCESSVDLQVASNKKPGYNSRVNLQVELNKKTQLQVKGRLASGIKQKP